jgi:hypothetical protein
VGLGVKFSDDGSIKKIESLQWLLACNKMPPTRDRIVERLLLRVDNAIHNPTATVDDVKHALVLVKEHGIPIYNEDYDSWIHLAIAMGDRKKLRCLFPKGPGSSLRILLINPCHAKYISPYVRSKLFNMVESVNILDELSLFSPLCVKENLIAFFSEKKTWPVLSTLCKEKEYSIFKPYYSVNPVARKRKRLYLTLLRFWFTVKRILRHWRESLYVPGTGALYKKAEASFRDREV